LLTKRPKMMAALGIIVVLALSSSANAVPLYDVWHDTDGDGVKDNWLGRIEAYTGGLSSTANFNYFSASAHPINGPTPEAYKSKMYLYDGSDGFSFGFFHNIDAGGNNYWNHVRWEIDFTNMTSSLGLVDDNTPENHGEIGIIKTGSHYDAGWAYIRNTDGGVINGLTPTDPYWEIIIDPSHFGDIQEWQMYSGSGSSISLWTNPTGLPGGLGSGDDYHLATRAHTTFITPVPEPATLILLGSGLLGGALIRRRKRR